jgi:cytoskeletal protein CcmA (bactofilin family)
MFSKKPEERSPAAGPRPVASGGGTFSVFGADVVIKGNVSATADLHVDGTVEGDIACASLVQGESSLVAGAIEAETARLSGRVKGTITVRELVILRSARIEGDVHYDTLTIEQGAQVEGRFAHDAAKPAVAKPTAQVLDIAKDEEQQRLSIAN